MALILINGHMMNWFSVFKIIMHGGMNRMHNKHTIKTTIMMKTNNNKINQYNELEVPIIMISTREVKPLNNLMKWQMTQML